MYILPKGTEITIPLLQEFLDKHRSEVNDRFKKLKDAFESDHDILHAEAKPSYKPDNRIVVNFAKYMVETFGGFFIGNPIKTVAEDSKVAEYVEHIEQYNDQDDNNAELSKLMDIFGRGFEVYFTDEESELCITYMSPMEAFMIYDDSIVQRPMYFVRRWTDRQNTEYGCIQGEGHERNFKVTGGLQWLGDWKPHHFSGVPAVEFIENEERQGLFEPIMPIINAYNKAISEKANDVDYFADAYLKILGVALDEDGIKHIRSNRIINFEGENAEKLTVEFMGKPESDTAQENLLNRLERLAFQISMVANISDESFGNASGISLKYKLLPMMNLARVKERKFVSGMNRRYKLLFSHPASKVPKDAWMQLDYQFTPNVPANILEEAQIAAQLEGVVSDETKLKVLSIVDNVEEELKRIEEENKPAESTIVDDMMFGNAPVEENATPTEPVEEVIDNGVV